MPATLWGEAGGRTRTVPVGVDTGAARAVVARGRAPGAILAMFLLCLGAWSCAGEVEPETTAEALRGVWSAELLLVGESLPFRLELSPGAAVPGTASGAGANVAVTALELRARAWVLVLGDAGTELVGRLSPDGNKLEGFWQPRDGSEGAQVPFVALRGAGVVAGGPPAAPGRPAGRRWVATVQLGGEPTVGRLEATLPTGGAGAASGRLRLPDGAELAVVGEVDDGSLELRSFDGRRAVLMRGRVRPGRIDGWIWTGAGPTGTWSAAPAGRRPVP